MIKVNKGEEPQILKDFIRRYNPRSWDDFTPEIKSKIKECLLKETDDFCPYCEIKLDLAQKITTEIEHIKSRSSYPNGFKEYNNFTCACVTAGRCGNSKGSAEILNPVIENPEDYYTYNEMTGEIVLRDGNNSQLASKTIEHLNLNQLKLVSMRKAVISQLNSIPVGELNGCLIYLTKFPSLINWYKKEMA